MGSGVQASVAGAHMDLATLWHVSSSQKRGWTCVPCIGRWILNHWTTSEVLSAPIWWGLVHFHISFSQSGFPSDSNGKESACNAEDPGSIPRSGRSPGEENGYPLQYSCLENPMDSPRGRKESQRVWHDWETNTHTHIHTHIIMKLKTSFSLFTFMHWRRKWQPTPVFLPGEYQGQGSLVGCRLWGHTESDMTEVT